MKSMLGILTAAAILGLGATVSAPALAQSGNPVRIAATFPLTGNAAAFGEIARNGAQLAIEQVNADGGLFGQPVTLDVQDNRCNPTEAVKLVTQMLSDPGYTALFDGLCSSVILATMPVVQRVEIPFMVATASATSISEQSGAGGNVWTFKFNPTDLTMATAMVKWLNEKGLADKVAFLGEDTDFGRSGSEGFTKAMDGIGKKMMSEDYYQQGVADFSAVLTKLKATQPSVIALYGLSGDQQNIINQMVTFGLKVPLTGRLQTDVMPPQALAEGFLDGTTSVQPYSVEMDTPENAKFVSQFKERFGNAPNSIGYSAYEAMHTLLDAIKRAGSTDKAAVREALKATNYPSMLGGFIQFDDNNLAHNNAVILLIEGGKATVAGVSKT